MSLPAKVRGMGSSAETSDSFSVEGETGTDRAIFLTGMVLAALAGEGRLLKNREIFLLGILISVSEGLGTLKNSLFTLKIVNKEKTKLQTKVFKLVFPIK